MSIPLLFGQPYVHTPLTLSGNEITDGTRGAALAGDGLSEDSSYGIWEATTNLCTNGGFETNTTGWTTGGTNTLASSSAQAKFGAKSGLATYQDNATLADFGVTITNAPHTFSAWVYIPTAYDGGGVELRQTGFTVAASAVAASMGTRDAWQKLTLTATPGADVTGNVQINNTGAAPTAGRTINIDGVQIEAQPIATPYIETDGGTASRSEARVQAPASLLDETQGWVALRIRMPIASTAWGATVPHGGGQVFCAGWADSASEYLFGRILQTPVSLDVRRRTAGAGNSATKTINWAAGEVVILIGSWTATLMGASFNGSAFTTAANTNIPTLAASSFDIGAGGATFANVPADGDILWFACGTGTLTDADAALFYAWGNSDPQWHWFPKSAVITGLWHARSPMMKIRRGL